MIKRAISALLFIATTLSFEACSNGVIENPNNGQTPQDDTVSMTIVAECHSRTGLAINDSDANWQEGDKIVVIENGTRHATSTGAIIDNSERAHFNVSFARVDQGNTFTYNAIYPAESTSFDKDVDIEAVRVALSAKQHPTTSSFDPKADILVASYSTSDTQPTELNVRFERLVAIGALTLENMPSNSKIDSLTISLDDNFTLAGENLVNCRESEVAEYGYAHPSSLIQLIYDTPHDASMPVYFTCNPVTLSEDEEFTITATTTNDVTYKQTVVIQKDESLVLKAGKLTSITVDMNPKTEEGEDDNTKDDGTEDGDGNEDDTEDGTEDGDSNDDNTEEGGNEGSGNEGEEEDDQPADTYDKCIFRRVSSVTSGKAYLLAADGYIATPIINKEYGYLQVATGDQDDDGVIELDNCNDAFVIEATNGGYTLRQVADSRYLYQYSNYNSFNVSTSLSEGYVWSISTYSYDDTFTITNNSRGKFIQYNGTYTSFGSYANLQNEGVRPMLYELDGDIVIDDNKLPGEDDDNDDNTPSVTPDDSWLELPATPSQSDYPNAVTVTVMSGDERNYTHFYDKSTYTTMWVAYPLERKHMGSYSRPDSWDWNPYIDQAYQVNLCNRSYSGTYSRGHLIPNASRNGIRNMQLQTFYVTNSVPQVQNGFNGGIWQNLESALQSVGKSELIYIVTGVAFNKEGESRTIEYTTAKDDTKRVPIPNYFYKVVLKVNTNSSGEVTGASTVGFWFENKAYSGSAYDSYTTTVDQIEAWTGFDFFVGLPDTIESTAEQNSSWSTFKNW